MTIPLISIVTLLAEILITVFVYYVIWHAYTTGRFIRRLAFGILAYELVFNISYMLSRELSQKDTRVYNPYETFLAIFHGIFSIIMFVTLVVFFLVATRVYNNKDNLQKEKQETASAETNFFRNHKYMTGTFVVAWGVSILSGITLFYSLYLF